MVEDKFPTELQHPTQIFRNVFEDIKVHACEHAVVMISSCVKDVMSMES